jgi:hypothetical protein
VVAIPVAFGTSVASGGPLVGAGLWAAALARVSSTDGGPVTASAAGGGAQRSSAAGGAAGTAASTSGKP